MITAQFRRTRGLHVRKSTFREYPSPRTAVTMPSRRSGVVSRIRRSPFAADVRRYINDPISTRFGLLLTVACIGAIALAIAFATRGYAWV